MTQMRVRLAPKDKKDSLSYKYERESMMRHVKSMFGGEH